MRLFKFTPGIFRAMQAMENMITLKVMKLQNFHRIFRQVFYWNQAFFFKSFWLFFHLTYLWEILKIAKCRVCDISLIIHFKRFSFNLHSVFSFRIKKVFRSNGDNIFHPIPHIYIYPNWRNIARLWLPSNDSTSCNIGLILFTATSF